MGAVGKGFAKSIAGNDQADYLSRPLTYRIIPFRSRNIYVQFKYLIGSKIQLISSELCCYVIS